MAIKVLLDSQIGDNIDDAFALALACMSEELNLVGVTTTYHASARRAVLARRLLAAYGRAEVPVAVGDHPRYGQEENATFCQSALADANASLSADAGMPATAFMAKVVGENPGITLIATGPLTNIGELLRRYPRLEGQIGRIVFMGGWSTQAMPEFNLGADPEAAATVLLSSVPLLAVDFETTLSCVMRRSHLLQCELSSGDGPRLLYALTQCWMQARRRPIVMHDPLTVAVLCRPDLFCLAPRSVRSYLHEPVVEALAGDGGARKIVGTQEVDAQAYLGWMLDRVAPIDPATHRLIDAEPTAWELRPGGAYRLIHHQGWSVHGAQRSQHTVCYVQEGSCRLRGQGFNVRLAAGSAFYLPCDCEYWIESAEGMVGLWLHFDVVTRRVGEVTKVRRIQDAPVGPLPPEVAAELGSVLDKAVRYLNHPRPEHTVRGYAALQEVLASLLTAAYTPGIERASRAASALHEAKRFIESHVAEPITLDQLSRCVYMSKYHLSRLFKEMYGLSPMQYHTKLRMQKAEAILRSHTCSVYEVALSCGYNSIQSFSRVFREFYGVSPGQYRKRFLQEKA